MLRAARQRPQKQDLRELGAGVQLHGADVVGQFGGAGEGDVGAGGDGAVEVGGLQDEARVGRALEEGEQGQGEVELGDVVDLDVGVEAVLGFAVGAYALACVAYELALF